MDVTIRPIEPADLPFLWEMAAAAAHVPGVAAFRSNPALARYVGEWGKPDDLALVAVDPETDQRVGAIWMRLFPDTDPGFGYYDDRTPEMGLAVVEGSRGGGIARRLLGELLVGAARHYPGVTLAVFESNLAAIRLYRSVGFEKFGEYGNSRGEISWRMRVDLG